MDDLQQREARALRWTDRAWLGAVTWAVTLLVLSLLALMAERPWQPHATLRLGGLLPVLGVAAGIAQRKRAAACCYLLLVLLVEGGTVARTGSGFALLLLLVFGTTAIFGVLGTVTWHRVQRERARSAAPHPIGAAPAPRAGV
jgi:hypothetical protein